MKKIEVQDHGIMLMDYFSGSTGVILTIPVDKNNTVKDIFDYIDSEINMIYDHIYFTAEKFNFTDSEVEQLLPLAVADYKNDIIYGLTDQPFKDQLDYNFADFDDVENLPVLILTLEFIED